MVLEANDQLMTCTEVADLFRVDPKTVARWASEGRLQGIRTLGGLHRFPRAEVERVLAEGEDEGDPSRSRQLYPRPAPTQAVPTNDPPAAPSAEPVDVEPMPDAGVVWAYLDADTGDAVLTLTDDARGTLRLRPGCDEHEVVLLAVLGAAMASARTAQDQDTAGWWRAVAHQGEAILDEMRGIGHLPRVSREDP